MGLEFVRWMDALMTNSLSLFAGSSPVFTLARSASCARVGEAKDVLLFGEANRGESDASVYHTHRGRREKKKK
jgi:hypothetical protein